MLSAKLSIIYLPIVSLLKSASTVSLLTLASRVTGLARELMVASVFGASEWTDAFNVAFRIPNLFRRFFAEGAFSQAFVPALALSKVQHGEAETKRVIDDVATVLSWVLVLTCLLGVLAAPVMVWAMASGLQQAPAGYAAAIHMTQIMFPYIGFMSLVALSAGILNTWKQFAVPAATPVLLNLCMIGAAWWGVPYFRQIGIEPINAMAVGVMGGGLLQLAIQVPALQQLGLLPRIGLTWSRFRAACADPVTGKIVVLMMPALLGVGVAQLSMLINTQIASHLAPGSVSWITYADRLMEFPTAMLGVALGVVLMPQLAAARAKQDAQAYSDLLDWGLRLVFLLALPSAVALLTLAQPLVATLYHYGAFTAVDVAKTEPALMGWGVGLVGMVAIKVLAPGYFAHQDTKTPVRIAIGVLIATQIMNALLVPFLAHAALTLSIGLGGLLNALWLYWGLRRRGSYQPLPGWSRFCLQILLACAVMAAFLMWANGAIDWLGVHAAPGKGWRWVRIGELGAVIVAAALIYFAVLRGLGLPFRQFVRR
jgi:putative peptidoglycan lipid II flippase